jgi:predicted membrane protein
VQVNSDMPMELIVNVGAGTSDLNLSQVALNSLDLSTGAGNVTVDLTGKRERDVPIKIIGGAGTLKLLLPKDVGVRVKASTGIGSIEANGLTKDGESYVNDAYGKSPASLDIDISAGVGAVMLDVVE